MKPIGDRWISLRLTFIGILMWANLGSSMELDPSAIRGSDKARPVVVLQNRYFTKVMRPEFGFSAGKLLNEAYTDTTTTGFRGSLFFTEWAGIEAQFLKTSVTDSKDRQALKQLKYKKIDSEDIVSPDVEINPVYNSTDINGIIAPFYGKLNLFDKFIIYSDLYLTAGVSSLDTQQGEKTAISIGAGQRFYWKKYLSVRIDFRNRNFRENRSGVEYSKNSQSVDFGVSFFFL